MRDCFEIITNYYCNLGCKFCSQIMSGFSFSNELILKEIYTAKKSGFRRIGFSGGESTLREEISFYIKTARKVGFDFIRLQTNGYLLASSELSHKLIDSGLSYVKFTFLSHKKDIHDLLVSKTGAFEASLKGLKNFINKTGVGVNILINSKNYKNLKDDIKFFLELGVSDFVIIYPIYTARMYENRGFLKIPISRAFNSIVEVLDMADAYRITGSFKILNIPPCLLGKYAKRSADFYRFNTVVSEPGIGRYDIDEQMKINKIKDFRSFIILIIHEVK